jgi:hypothetical protein
MEMIRETVQRFTTRTTIDVVTRDMLEMLGNGLVDLGNSLQLVQLDNRIEPIVLNVEGVHRSLETGQVLSFGKLSNVKGDEIGSNIAYRLNLEAVERIEVCIKRVDDLLLLVLQPGDTPDILLELPVVFTESGEVISYQL